MNGERVFVFSLPNFASLKKKKVRIRRAELIFLKCKIKFSLPYKNEFYAKTHQRENNFPISFFIFDGLIILKEVKVMMFQIQSNSIRNKSYSKSVTTEATVVSELESAYSNDSFETEKPRVYLDSKLDEKSVVVNGYAEFGSTDDDNTSEKVNFLQSNQENFCQVAIFSYYDNDSNSVVAKDSTAEVFALIKKCDSDSSTGQSFIELHCYPNFDNGIEENDRPSVIRLDFEGEVISHCKVLPLPPVTNASVTTSYDDDESNNQVLGVLLAVVSDKAISTKSVVLCRKSSSEKFEISECIEIFRRNNKTFELENGEFNMSDDVSADHQKEEPQMFAYLRTPSATNISSPILFLAASSRQKSDPNTNAENPLASSYEVNIIACSMANHFCPIFKNEQKMDKHLCIYYGKKER